MIRNISLFKKWIAALRSDTYKQANNQLRDNDSYCCLGVICNEIDSTKWDKKPSGIFKNIEKYYYDGAWDELSAKIRKEIGIHEEEMAHLIYLNDCKKLSFSEIADYLESLCENE